MLFRTSLGNLEDEIRFQIVASIFAILVSSFSLAQAGLLLADLVTISARALKLADCRDWIEGMSNSLASDTGSIKKDDPSTDLFRSLT